MADPTPLLWSAGSHSGLVPVGTHKLHAQISGPTRKSGAPLAIVFNGLGGGTFTWPAVMRGVSAFARILVYERTGCGRSEKEPSPTPRTSVAIAEELSTLLKAVDQEPPYVLIAQSYGGVLCREFLAQRPHDVVGLCLIDTNTEDTHRDRPIPMEAFGAMMAGLDTNMVLDAAGRAKLTPEEVQELLVDGKSDYGNEYAGLEQQSYVSSMNDLAAHKQYENQVLGDKPVSVVKGNSYKDIQMIYDAAVAKGNGTEEQRKQMMQMIESMEEVEVKLQKDQLRLSSTGRLVVAKESGHNVQVTEPEVVVGEVKWIYETLGML
ncbi:hypothetical protein MMC19_001317 [Ptychographa xylographoides]|nr:hypothetical protein [Ptychographa xylographoides]